MPSSKLPCRVKLTKLPSIAGTSFPQVKYMAAIGDRGGWFYINLILLLDFIGKKMLSDLSTFIQRGKLRDKTTELGYMERGLDSYWALANDQRDLGK